MNLSRNLLPKLKKKKKKKKENKLLDEELNKIEEKWFKTDRATDKETAALSQREEILEFIQKQDEFKNIKKTCPDEEEVRAQIQCKNETNNC
ncbi:conserved Plasmodium protein, unknown function [Plasmodium malariae]|uniref:Uncharacterized protein n=1 Tax=Plasmodium malariae TaxID=5858 RepID=A0A1A8W736_PLAMA|nr:conserved Plasmodium protein, unknown function [Plasmodium malariae]